MKGVSIMTNGFPYKKYMKSRLWKVVETALDDLEENQDIVFQTPQEYVTGYLVKALRENFTIKSAI